ncbi:MAG: hypothetical protein U0X39_11040 [Bacteroidales bacterium]
MKRLIGTLLLPITFLSIGISQVTTSGSLRIMFYNTENLFDSTDDSLKNDEEFLPGGLRHWTYSRYHDKLNSIYKVIMAAGNPEPPAIIGLCEVENQEVLNKLVTSTFLSSFDYRIIQEDSRDSRGIDVCLIYRPGKIKPLNFRYLYPVILVEKEYSTRSILYFPFIYGADTIHLFINHWPSGRGGVLPDREARLLLSGMVIESIDSLSIAGNGKSKVIVTGDFNCLPERNELLATNNKTIREKSPALLLPVLPDSDQGIKGSYKYQGQWELLDQFWVSEYFASCSKGLTAPSSSIVLSKEFMLKRDPVYPGLMPFSTFRGFSYTGGFSDHLPVILDLLNK